ncbi:SGNH/GDSL hydrolase family protein [Candidatus Saccharibacteria bacterium]|nr:SGNH/GDSL hydrolase family protein [Candidatus Saccharibacteria bacterium]
MRRFIFSVTTLALLFGAILSPTANALPVSPTYVALGDSVAAGAGLPLFSNATTEDVLCKRSYQAYPYKIAAQLNTSVTQLSCSGAKVDEGIYGTQNRSGTNIAPQLTKAFQNGAPDLMTVTIGANDARWTQFIRDCYVFRCGSKFDDVRAKVYRADLRIELYRMLYQINQMSGDQSPQVLLNGYYAPFSSQDCADSDRITLAERAWLNDQTARLNQAIKSVVPYFSFAKYVPVNFSGHELCSSAPWIQGKAGVAPFHPTANGQTAIARSFLSSTH